MTEKISTDVLIIGAGAAGFYQAKGTAHGTGGRFEKTRPDGCKAFAAR